MTLLIVLVVTPVFICPLDQVNVYVALGLIIELAETVAAPVAFPKHKTFVISTVVKVVSQSSVQVIEIVCVISQSLASVIITE